jgi:hypothetical protein
MSVQMIHQILAVSEPTMIGLAMTLMIFLITVIAIWKYSAVGPVLQLWAAMGTLSGAMASYFFTRELTREQVQRKEAQIRMYQTALQASAKERDDAGKQVLAIAAQIKPDFESPQNREALTKLISVTAAFASPPASYGSHGLFAPGSTSSSPSPKDVMREWDEWMRRQGSPSPTP